MLDELNSAERLVQQLTQHALTFDEWPAPQVITLEHQEIEGDGNRQMVNGAAMQGLKVGNTVRSQADHF